MYIRLFLFFLFTQIFLFKSFGQDKGKMEFWQDSLTNLVSEGVNYTSDPERIEANNKFVKTLVSSLKETNAFYFNFEKLRAITILNAPDKSFRIFTWYVPLTDGSFLYYGAIQFASSDLKLIPLLDKTFEIKKPENEVLSGIKWYGSRYYNIVQLDSNQYILLGWKGHHREYSQKIIEVLTIKPNYEVLFGANLFSDNKVLARKIFSYTRQVNMYLQFNPITNTIEFDHIVPIQADMEGDYKYYGPDLTYDGYLIDNGSLKYIENIEVNNGSDSDNHKYIDPLRPSSKKSGIK